MSKCVPSRENSQTKSGSMGRKILTADWKNTARLYALVAPRARTGKAVLLRRGPSNHVRMILWDMKKDRFTPGQWLKKRVYERRCDLSPDGRLFIYFAADYKAGPGSWTAISRPPYFTALSMWQKGDGWGGGGLFSDDGRIIYLNHRPGEESELFEGFPKPPVPVRPLGDCSGWGEDDPICNYRMIRDGWRLIDPGARSEWKGFQHRYHFARKKPAIYEKHYSDPGRRRLWSLQLRSQYTGEVQGRWNVEEAFVVDRKGQLVLEIGRVDWCDLDQRKGDILWAWAGKLWRLRHKRDPRGFLLREPKLLGDFNDMTFENIKAPPQARAW